MQKEGDTGDAVSANYFQLCKYFGFARNLLQNVAYFCTTLRVFAFFCRFVHVFAHLLHAFLVLVFQTQSSVSAIFQFFCNSREIYCFHFVFASQLGSEWG